MLSSPKLHESVFSSGSEFRDGDSKLGSRFVFSAAADDDVNVERDASAMSVWRRLAHVELTALITVALLYGIALVSTWLLSLVVRVHVHQFPSGALTPMQLTAFTLCFFSIGLHVSNFIFTWLRCTRDAVAATRAACEVSVYLLLFFVCDRTALLPRRPCVGSADFFLFLIFAFVCAALATARRIRLSSHAEVEHARAGLLPSAATPTPSTGPELQASEALLNHHHVEEWLGWVLVLYVMYGYFHNVHINVLVRVCVSCFAFLTAFTSYVRYDSELPQQQSAVLLLRSLWKMNFLAVVTCALMGNQYMLYPICAVQSFVMAAVHLMMSVGPLMRSGSRVVGMKIGAVVVLGCVLWDTPFSPEVFRLFWSPLYWLVRYDNPVVGVDPLDEWQFRSRLDHWIWLVGVLVANRASFLNGLLRRLDNQRPVGTVIKCAVAAAAASVIAVYAYVALKTRAVDYDRYVPYFSWAPILAFVALRCVFRTVRCFYLPLCTFFGAFAVEAYVAHNHVFLATTGLNGGPLYTLHLLPGDHPLCDFGVFALLLLCVSYRLSIATPRLRQFMLPFNASLLTVLENLVILVLVVMCTYLLQYLWYSQNVRATTY